MPGLAARADMDRALFSGDGDGEARSAMRRIRSRPPGVLARASWGDRGGHCGGGPAPDPFDGVSLVSRCGHYGLENVL